MQRTYRIGMLTPSGNTVVEPLSYAMVAGCPEISIHFSRIPVSRVGLGAAAIAQFSIENFLKAANLLEEAKMDVIAWNGSSGSWIGPDFERLLCRRLQEETGVPATTTTEALYDAFRALGVRRYSLVAPFTADIIAKIASTYATEGFTCMRTSYVELLDTLEKGNVPRAEIRDLICKGAHPESDAIAVVCTNFAGAPLVAELEAELGVTVIDSVTATLWKCLEIIGARPRIEGWGRLLRELPATPVAPARVAG